MTTNTLYYGPHTVLSVRFEVGVSLLLAPTGADKRGPKAPFPPVENAGIQPTIHNGSTRQSSGRSRLLLKALLIRIISTCLKNPF